jgi:uncharacterized protein (TIGR02145 family)
MKTTRNIWANSLIGLGFLLLITVSCKKTEETPPPPPEPVVAYDIDGNLYHTVTIGTQVWMVENLKTTRYNDGSPIPLVADKEQWRTLSTPGFCWPMNDGAAYKSTYGGIYNWFAVNTGKLAPDGWHVPTEAEFKMMVEYLGGKSVAGGKMKEAGMVHWLSPNTAATNSSGFTAVPAGYRWDTLGFNGITAYNYLWTSTQFEQQGAWGFALYFDKEEITRLQYYQSAGFSVRCIEDSGPGTFTDTRDGKSYKTIRIGNQTWLAENLAYNLGSGCWAYDYNETNVAAYGYLYTWEAAKIAVPAGWHLPTDEEWTALTDFLGGAAIAGGKMKEAGTLHWLSPNTGADNSSGFTALPGGFRNSAGAFYYLFEGGNWWSATESTSSNAYNRYLGRSNGEAGRSSENKAIGQSVRCVKD